MVAFGQSDERVAGTASARPVDLALVFELRVLGLHRPELDNTLSA